jgi:hypothetical protein
MFFFLQFCDSVFISSLCLFQVCDNVLHIEALLLLSAGPVTNMVCLAFFKFCCTRLTTDILDWVEGVSKSFRTEPITK